MKKTKQSKPPELRDMLFADVPLSQWLSQADDAIGVEPWKSFDRAQRRLNAADRQGAAAILLEITEQSGLESRQYLEAWKALREIGVKPPDGCAKQLYGAVIEVHQSEGLDILAAYTDHTARYLNFSGAMIVWETRTASMDQHIDRLLRKSELVLQAIGPWQGELPAAPPRGQVRINMLTPGGLYFGQGPFDALAKDGLGGPVLDASMRLMAALVDVAQPVA